MSNGASEFTGSSSRLIWRREVCDRTGLSYTSIWRTRTAGSVPAARRKLNPESARLNSPVAWLDGEVSAWIHERIKVASVLSELTR